MKLIRNLVIAFVVVFVVAFAFSFLETLLDPSGTEFRLPRSIPMILGLSTFFLLNAFSTNRKVSRVPDADRNRMLAEAPPAGYGVVYVYRSGLMGWATGFDLFLDTVVVAQLKSPQFTRLLVPQGTHMLASGNTQIGAKRSNAGVPVSFTLASGETAVFLLKLKTGMVTTAVEVVREAYTPGTLPKLAKVPMVAPIEPEIARAA